MFHKKPTILSQHRKQITHSLCKLLFSQCSALHIFMAAIQLTPETAPANATTHVRQKKTMHAAHRK